MKKGTGMCLDNSAHNRTTGAVGYGNFCGIETAEQRFAGSQHDKSGEYLKSIAWSVLRLLPKFLR